MSSYLRKKLDFFISYEKKFKARHIIIKYTKK